MGQAKRRGSLEQRIKQSQESDSNFYGEKLSLSELQNNLGLSSEAKVLGYVIHLPDNDEFVAKLVDTSTTFSVVYAKTPELALKYENVNHAIKDAEKITKHKLLVCVLLEDADKYCINDVWANF